MRKNLIIDIIFLALFALLFVISLVGFIIGDNDVSFPIGYGVLALIFAYHLYLVVKEKEFFLSRLSLRKTIKYCENSKNNDIKKKRKLENFLNKRDFMFLTRCPICNRTSHYFAKENTCRRCKTLFKKEVNNFVLESKGTPKHRLALLYQKDFYKLKNFIELYKPDSDVNDTYNDDKITITVNFK